MSNENTNPTHPAPAAPQATEAPKRRRKGLIIAGVATAVVLAAGAGTVLTLSLTGDDPVDFRSASSNSGSSSSTGETDVDAMIAAADEALTVADGEVVSIEQQTDGAWRVEIQGDGNEYDVFVDDAGARIAEQDGDGDGDNRGLTADAVTAAVEKATSTVDGEVVKVASDDNRYSVEVRPTSGPSVELELDESFQVIGSETDD